MSLKSRVVSIAGYYEIDFQPNSGYHLTSISYKEFLTHKFTHASHLAVGQYVEGTSQTDWIVKWDKADDANIFVSGSTFTLPSNFTFDSAGYLRFVDGTDIPKLQPETKPLVHTCKFDKDYFGLIESFKYCSCGQKEKT